MTQTVNVASAVEDLARQRPQAVAMQYPLGRGADGQQRYIQYTYGELMAASDAIAGGLGAIGIQRGIRTALMVTPSLEFFALTFALLRAGIVPIIIDPGIGLKNLKTCLAEAQPEAFIGVPKAHAARVLMGWARGTLKIQVTVGRKWFWGGHTLEEVKARSTGAFQTVPTSADETAAIIFTSGSTGIPKGVVYTHGNFMAQVSMLRDLYAMQPGEIDLPTFPVFALFDPAFGMTTVIPEMDFTRPGTVNPPDVIEPIQKFGITNMFGSPALLNRVGRYGVEKGVKLPSLRRVISAGAPVPATVLERFAAMLPPEAEIVTPYGATEALPIASISHREILSETRFITERGGGVCVGRPVPEMEVCVIRITDEPIVTWAQAEVMPPGEIGEIAVRGASVSRSYFNRETATRLAKISTPDGGFYHRMGDLGYLDEGGRLWFCGRKSHRVITPQGTLYTIPCEGVFNTHPKVFRTALVGVKREGVTMPVLCVELEPDAQQANQETITRELLAIGAKFPHTQSIQTVLYHPAFPVDIRHNAKIFREKLAVWAERKLS